MRKHTFLSLMIVLSMLLGGVLVIAQAAPLTQPRLAPLPALPGYSYTAGLEVRNNDTASLPAGYTVSFTLNTQALISAGRLQDDCDDLRISFTDVTENELDRLVTGCGTAATQVQFRTQASIAAGMTDERYTFNYGNAGAASPPQNPANVYYFYDDFQDGNANGWTVTKGNWGMVNDAGNYVYRYTDDGANWPLAYTSVPLSDLDYTARIRATDLPKTDWIGLAFRILDPSTIPDFLTFYQSRDTSNFKYGVITNDGHANPIASPGYTMGPNAWYRIRIQAVGSTVRARIWADGAAEPATWTISTTTTTYQSSTNIGLTLYFHTTNADWDDIQVRRLVATEPTVTLMSTWWDNTYPYRRNLTITNTSASAALQQHFSASIVLDTAALIGGNQMLPDCSDLRVIYDPGLVPVEIDRVVENCGAAQTTVWFALQRPVPPSGQDLAYTLYYGNAAASAPPANGMNVFLFFEDWEQGTFHWINAGGLDGTNAGEMGQSVISTDITAISPSHTQKYPFYGAAGDAKSGYIPVTPSTSYAISVWGWATNANVCGPVGFDWYDVVGGTGTENWLWTSEWRIGPEWAWHTANFTTGTTTNFIKIKGEIWNGCSTPGQPPLYFDNLALRYSISSQPALVLGDEETILPVPIISNIVDTDPVVLGANAQVSADISTSTGTITSVTLQISSPEVANIPMMLVSGTTTNGTWQATSFTPAQGGLYTYRVRAEASPALHSTSAALTFTVADITAPQITFGSLAVDPILVKNTQTLIVQVTDNGALSSVTVNVEGATHPMTAGADDQYSYSWQVNATGTVPYIVTATDTSNNLATLNGSFVSNADTLAPSVTFLSLTADPILVRNTQTLVVMVTDNGLLSSVTVNVEGGTHPITAGADHQYSYSWQVQTVGTIPYNVTATDASSNVTTLNGSFASQAREVDVCTWKDCRQGAASWSIDDGNSSCSAELGAAGIKGTYFYNGSSTQGWFSTYSAAGHEIASHTVGHPCNTPACSPTCTPESLAAIPVDPAIVTAYRRDQIEPNIAVIEAGTGKPVLSLAWPCGCTDPSRMQAASYTTLGARGYYDYIAVLTWLEDVNLPTPVNIFNLNTANAYRQDFVDRAYAEGKWSITTSHGSCTGIDYLGAQNANGHLWVAPIGEVLKYIKVRDASQFTSYTRAGRTISFDVAHNLSSFLRQKVDGSYFPSIVFDNPVTLKIHLLDSDTVQGVTMDGVPVSYLIQNLEGTRYITFDATLNASRHVVVTLAAPAPALSQISASDPVELGSQATFNATVIPAEGTTLGPVTLRILSPESHDYAMSLISGDQYTASFTPGQLGAYSYQVVATNNEGASSQSTPASFTVVDTTPPTSRNQSQSSNQISMGGLNVLTAEGSDLGGVVKAILLTDESGSWQEFDWPVSNWWNHNWAHRRTVTVAGTAGLARSYETVDLLVSSADFGGLSSCVGELRVTDENQVEIPSQVYDEQENAGVRTCHLLFQATVGADLSRIYYIYYGNPSATAPTYATDLTVNGTSLLTIQNAYFNLDLDTAANAGIITRMRLPQGSNANLPLSTSANSYWGWHQVCSSVDGNITGKNSLCVGGTAQASGLTMAASLTGPLAREYTLTSTKGAATYTMKYRFYANSPFYQYSLTRADTAAGVMNNFWYLNGYFPRLGAGPGGTPADTFNTYDYNNDHLLIASLDTVAVASIDGMDNDGTDLGGTDYNHPTAPGLDLIVATGVDQTAAQEVLARLNAPLTVTPGTVENAPAGQYGSPIALTPGSGWVTTSFNWQNPAYNNRYVHWRIKYLDTSGNFLYTPVMSFAIGTPTAVTVSSFTGSSHMGTAQLDWETASEIGLLGFNLHRSEALDGLKHKLNANLIPAQHSGQMQGASYQFSDNVDQGKRYYYWLELVKNQGTELFDPVVVDADYLVRLPFIRR